MHTKYGANDLLLQSAILEISSWKSEGLDGWGAAITIICHIKQHVHFLPLPMNIRTNQIKSCPNLERLSLQNIRLNDAVAKLVPQLLIKPTLLRTWLTS